MSVHIFGTPNAVITLLSSVRSDLTPVSYSINFIFLELIILYSEMRSYQLDAKVFNLSSLTARSDINVCLLPISSKIFATQN